jgi:serine/threonine protein kinase
MFYVAGILDAICHLHQKNIVFRDLKPENIMVDSDGYPKLIDLGFAKKLHHHRTFTICGTP